ncbi:MAG: hypothetical protein A3F78_21705 [Burkholderiales bacterium RIFCSPLOWO2_12_FULL_61_40]|nr:MAG: hypothetical protein A3F78_21705 [Burkholderiales bacterium RIFCSPLOWO2_12_FULL_61_40]
MSFLAVVGKTGLNCAVRYWENGLCWSVYNVFAKHTFLTPTHSATIFGCTMSKNTTPLLPDWELVVKAGAAHIATAIFDRVCDMESERTSDEDGRKP